MRLKICAAKLVVQFGMGNKKKFIIELRRMFFSMKNKPVFCKVLSVAKREEKCPPLVKIRQVKLSKKFEIVDGKVRNYF